MLYQQLGKLSLPSMGLGKSSTGLSGWGYGGARSTVRLCRVILIIMAGAAP